jgi:subtilisin family serine protease
MLNTLFTDSIVPTVHMLNSTRFDQLQIVFPYSLLSISFDEHILQLHNTLHMLSSISNVLTIDIEYPVSFRNAKAHFLTQSGSSSSGTPIWNKGLKGDGQIVGVADSGLDISHCYFSDSATDTDIFNSVRTNARKVIRYQTLPGADKTDDQDGHGKLLTLP